MKYAALTLTLCALTLPTYVTVVSSAQLAGDAPKILLFSKTSGFRHGSINNARSVISQAAMDEGFDVDTTEDAADFNAANLAQYDAVVFMLTSGNVLDDTQQTAFEQYIQAGNGYAGIHSASDTEYQWPWYGDLIGAYFDSHPAVQEATVNIEISDHPSTEGLPLDWVRTDEWYNFQENPRADVNVLATLDESTYNGGNMGSDHPIAWFHEFDGGRSWYTGGGHRSQSYDEPEFVQHLMGGIRYAAGLTVTGPDTDGDSQLDTEDNCVTLFNEDQRDTNGDGFGNICDQDLNNDCIVNAADLGIFRTVFFSDDPDADFNGDGTVNVPDLGLMRVSFFGPPGPSGVTPDCQ
ncbi:MAG: ThuA domain-containing protein [Gammaproteobacteria bacterium]